MHRYKFFKIGTLRKAFGIDGWMRLELDQDKIYEFFDSLDHIFVDLNGEKLPYFIEGWDEEQGLVKFDDIHTPQQAQPLINIPILVSDRQVSAKDVEATLIQQNLVGFSVFDQNTGILGVIIDLMDNKTQWLATVETVDLTKTYLIPIAEEMIISINMEDQSITLQVPEGLIDL